MDPDEKSREQIFIERQHQQLLDAIGIDIRDTAAAQAHGQVRMQAIAGGAIVGLQAVASAAIITGSLGLGALTPAGLVAAFIQQGPFLVTIACPSETYPPLEGEGRLALSVSEMRDGVG